MKGEKYKSNGATENGARVGSALQVSMITEYYLQDVMIISMMAIRAGMKEMIRNQMVWRIFPLDHLIMNDQMIKTKDKMIIRNRMVWRTPPLVRLSPRGAEQQPVLQVEGVILR